MSYIPAGIENHQAAMLDLLPSPVELICDVPSNPVPVVQVV